MAKPTLDEWKGLALDAKQVRDAQKTYFKTRNSTDLDNSKKLERDFDKKIKEAVAREDAPPSLFDE